MAKHCRHCRRPKVNRPRGLCWTCYKDPTIRASYESTSKFGQRQRADFNGRAPLPKRPTRALGGSTAKIAVLRERAVRGETLFHPEDAPECVPQTGARRPSTFRAAG